MPTSTNTTTLTNNVLSYDEIVSAYFSLTITVLGTVFNILTFIILCRRPFRNTQVRPVLHYMRVMAIFDILMLYGWNINHYLAPIHGFKLLTLNMPCCRFFSFMSYLCPQTSAWLRVFVCIDRYLSLSHRHKTWLNYSSSILIIIGCIITIFTLLNVPFFVYACSYKEDGTISGYSITFAFYPLWDYLHLILYNCIPFLLMVLFNIGVIYHLITLRNTTTVQNSRIQHRAISITLLITTFLFLVMTVPVTIGFAFFSTANPSTLNVLDGLLYTYHISSFPLYMITFVEFRREFIRLFRCENQIQPFQPVIAGFIRTGHMINANRAWTN